MFFYSVTERAVQTSITSSAGTFHSMDAFGMPGRTYSGQGMIRY